MAHVERRTRNGKLTWRARYRGPDGRERSRTFDHKRDAEAFLATVEHTKARGEYVAPERGRTTVGEWAAEWRHGRVHLKPSTLASYDSLLTTQILPRWETVPLARVAHAHVVAWVAEMRAAHLSASRVRQAYHLFAAILGDAVLDRRLPTNPATGVKLPRLASKERRYLTHAQLRDLAVACGPFEVLVLTLGYTGLRWGEAAGLRVKRLDLLRRRLEVVEAVAEVNGRLIVGAPKTHQRRSVPLPAFLCDRLAELVADKQPDDFVFTSRRGGLLRVHHFRRGYFNDAARRIGVAGLVPHELRHTAASLAIAAGADVKGVQAALGHASATLTLDRYGHLWEDGLDAVAERIDAAARADANVPRPHRGPATVTHLARKAK